MPHTLITGGSSGLGEALAVELARRGHDIGLIARREGELARVAERVRQAGGTACFAPASVTDPEALTAAVRTIEAELGAVDTLVAGAGIGKPTPAKRFDAAKINRVMRINFEGVVNSFGAVLPAMLERDSGHVAAISSIAAYRGLAPSGAYSASKAAVSTLLESFEVELHGTGVTVTTIHPGFVRTPIVAKNEFTMPMLMEPDEAARRMADGLEARKREINFPRRMHALMRALQVLPDPVFTAIFRRVTPAP